MKFKKELIFTHVEHNFNPIYDKNSKILILGSLPSVKSREENFYYGHPSNRFWKLISFLTDNPQPITIEEKKNLLLKSGIAIWDVIKSCDIHGSSDSSIKNVVPASIEDVILNSNIEKIYANGTVAFNLYNKYCLKNTKIEIFKLPSTSPANAGYSFEKLVEKWRIILTSLDFEYN